MASVWGFGGGIWGGVKLVEMGDGVGFWGERLLKWGGGRFWECGLWLGFSIFQALCTYDLSPL